jgi:4'-phosphopantetheinyl transferase
MSTGSGQPSWEWTNVRVPLDFTRREGRYRGWLAAAVGPCPPEAARKILSVDEYARYSQFAATRRQTSYLLGRHAAKRALTALLGEPPSKSSMIDIGTGIFGFPVVHDGIGDVGISHTDGFAVAVAFPREHPLAVDIESRQQDVSCIVEQFTPAERRLLGDAVGDVWQFWCAKESLAKAIRTGLTTPMAVLEIQTVTRSSWGSEIYFKNFGQYRALGLDFGSFSFSLCLPKNSRLGDHELWAVKRHLEELAAKSRCEFD